MLAQPEPYLEIDVWDLVRLFEVLTFGVGLVVLLVGVVLRVRSGRRRPIAGRIVIACGALIIIAGVMSLGKVDPPYGFGQLNSPCYRFKNGVLVHVSDYEQCLQEHYSLTGPGIAGIVSGPALALSGVWLVLPPRQIGHPRPSSWVPA